MDTILGIDFGTTNSVAAVLQDGKVKVLRGGEEAIMPSVVGYDADGRLLVGTPARNQWTLAPDRTVRSIKRRMGEDETIRMGQQEYRPQEIAAMIIRTLKDRAQAELGQPIHKVVITVPAFFNETQREATREAGELAGLEVVRIVNEPTAASLTYQPPSDQMERLIVYDLGGGTFDVSVVQIEQGVVEVLASHGDTHLGGDDFDQLLLDSVCDDFAKQHKIDLRQSPQAKSRVLRAVEEAKKTLSCEPVAKIEEEFIAKQAGLPLHLDVEISRTDYEDLIEPLLNKTLVCVDQSLSDAGLKVNQIDRVVLVGGASRTPMVHRLLREQLGQEIHSQVDPDLCVAMGAAIQAGLVAGIDFGPVLVDITPHTLGVRCLGELQGHISDHVFSAVIHRNTALPATRSEIYKTSHDGQKKVLVGVYQGEDEDVRHNQEIGEFYLKDLADVPRGNEILVRFHLDLDGILKVTASEHSSGRQEELTIENAISGFHQHGREEARARLETAFQSLAGAGDAGTAVESPSAEAPPEDELPPELKKAVAEAQELITKSERVASTANPDDAEEMDRLANRLRSAITRRSQSDIDGIVAELEDLVFYLEDA